MTIPIEEKKWAKKANQLKFSQVETIRSSAGNWRNGLVALTALLATVTILKGPEKASDLSLLGRIVVAVILAYALATLLLGSAAALRAAYGLPPRKRLLTGTSLREWSADEADAATHYLHLAIRSFFVAVGLIAIATALTWFEDDLFPAAGPPALVLVERREEGRALPQQICGELKSSTERSFVLQRDSATGKRKSVVLYEDVRGIKLVQTCP